MAVMRVFRCPVALLGVLAVGLGAVGCDSEQRPTGAIVFSQGAGNDIFEMTPVRGSRLRRLTRLPGAQLDPSWSPDGRRIVFRDSGRGVNLNDEISVMDADGTHVRNLTRNPANDWSPAWSPDGNRIVFASERSAPLSLWTMRTDGSRPTRLTNGTDEYPAWSPDGDSIAYGHGLPQSDIWLVRPDGSSPHALTRSLDPEWLPAWSPDGDRIAYVRGYEGETAVWVMNADGSDQRQLTHGSTDMAPAWAPDGKRLVFSRDEILYLLNADGDHLESLAVKGVLPSWGDPR
jgi:TolB protein